MLIQKSANLHRKRIDLNLLLKIFGIILVFLANFVTSNTTHYTTTITTTNDDSLVLINQNLIQKWCTKPVTLINTLDGTLHLYEINDLNKEFKKLWSINLSHTIITSSIDKLELYNDDNSLIRIIPSLDGSLFKYYGINQQEERLNTPVTQSKYDYIERIPLNMDDLLKTSIKLNNKVTFIGGINTHTFGIDIQNGQVMYNCSSLGCENKQASIDAHNDNLIVVKQTNYLLRAIQIQNGTEMWNMTLIKNEIISYPDCDTNTENDNDLDYQRKFSLNLLDNIEEQLRFDVSKGIFKYKTATKQEQNLNKPIVTCELFFNGYSKPVNIFENIHTQQQEKQPNKPKRQLQPHSTQTATNINSGTSLYIGKYDKQYYAQYNYIFDRSNTNGNSILLMNNQIYLNKKMLNTKSTYLKSGMMVSNENDNNRNSLVLYKNENFIKNVNQERVENGEDDSGKDVIGGWFFIENYIDDIDTMSNYISMSFTYNQVLIFLVTISCIIIATYFIIIRKNLHLRRQLSNQTKLSRNRTTSTVLHQISNSSTSSESNHPSLNSNANLTASTNTNVIGSGFVIASNHSSNNLFDINTIDNELQLRVNDDDSYESRYLTEFQHIRLIGKGGFGFVFEAKHRIDERVFAIKRIKLKTKKNAKDKVLREVRTLAKLESPYIVRYFHSWFEYPPVSWQKNIDEVLLKQTNSNQANTTTLTSQFTGQSSSIGGNETTDTNVTDVKSDFDHTQNQNTNSSSFIVFENSNNEKEVKSIDTWSDDGDDDHDCPDVVSSQSDDSSKLKLLSKKKSKNNKTFYIYIQMELCQRETLRHWIDLYKYEKRERHHILNIFEQILHAISYIHSKDLIHRDLKPSNIFLSLDGKTIKIGDFGLVVSAEQQYEDDDTDVSLNEQQNTTQIIKPKKVARSNDGTFLYMSPEQLCGQDYTYKVDIYSIGIILFELIVSFDTQMERIETLKNLNKQKFPPNFTRDYIIEKKLISMLIDINPNNRPSADEIFEHRLFKDFQAMYIDE